MKTEKSLVLVEHIERTILLLRGHRVLLDTDLATFYCVKPHRLNEQVRRNIDRFPSDFMFQLTTDEYESLRSQIAILKKAGRGQHRKYLPYAFTEHGAIMAASVLNSPKAVEMSVLVVRAFVRLRNLLSTNRQLATKLEEIERIVSTHDTKFEAVFEAIRELMEPPPSKPKRRIGFVSEDTI